MDKFNETDLFYEIVGEPEKNEQEYDLMLEYLTDNPDVSEEELRVFLEELAVIRDDLSPEKSDLQKAITKALAVAKSHNHWEDQERDDASGRFGSGNGGGSSEDKPSSGGKKPEEKPQEKPKRPSYTAPETLNSERDAALTVLIAQDEIRRDIAENVDTVTALIREELGEEIDLWNVDAEVIARLQDDDGYLSSELETAMFNLAESIEAGNELGNAVGDDSGKFGTAYGSAEVNLMHTLDEAGVDLDVYGASYDNYDQGNLEDAIEMLNEGDGYDSSEFPLAGYEDLTPALNESYSSGEDSNTPSNFTSLSRDEQIERYEAVADAFDSGNPSEQDVLDAIAINEDLIGSDGRGVINIPEDVLANASPAVQEAYANYQSLLDDADTLQPWAQSIDGMEYEALTHELGMPGDMVNEFYAENPGSTFEDAVAHFYDLGVIEDYEIARIVNEERGNSLDTATYEALAERLGVDLNATEDGNSSDSSSSSSTPIAALDSEVSAPPGYSGEETGLTMPLQHLEGALGSATDAELRDAANSMAYQLAVNAAYAQQGQSDPEAWDYNPDLQADRPPSLSDSLFLDGSRGTGHGDWSEALSYAEQGDKDIREAMRLADRLLNQRTNSPESWIDFADEARQAIQQALEAARDLARNPNKKPPKKSFEDLRTKLAVMKAKQLLKDI